MEKLITILEVVMPILTAVGLGMLARRRQLISAEGIGGFQKFVMQFGLPCVVFNSCLMAQMGAESLVSMALAAVMILIASLMAFAARKRRYPYHNLPMLFSAQETGMLGIPLLIILFGAGESYRMGVLDLAQAVVAYPVIALLSADTGENPDAGEILRKVLKSPLVIMSGLGLLLNLTGGRAWMESVGILNIVTRSASFLTEPVSALMLFSVGYNFSLGKESRGTILRISAVHFMLFAVMGVAAQFVLCLLPQADVITRWVLALYCLLPGSYLSPGLGRCEEDYTMASGVCSLLTVATLACFCVMTALVA